MRPWAIVTGGARRIGAVIVRDLVETGWQVCLHYHSSAGEAQALAGELAPFVETVAADLTSIDAAERIFAAVPGGVAPRLLVNCASGFVEDQLEDFETSTWDDLFNTNVRAPALLTRRFARADADGDRLIVNLLDAKLANPNTDYFSYTVSKAALAGLTELSARRLAARGIRVCGIAPAMLLPSPGMDAAGFERRHRMTALGRGVSPAEVVRTVRYLLEMPTLTGVVVTIDGGQRFLGLQRDVEYL